MRAVKTALLTIVSLVAFISTGEPAVQVNGLELSREEIFDSAEKIISSFKGEYDGLKGKDAWRQLLEDMVMDFKLSVIALAEVKSRNIKMPPPIDYRNFAKQSVYRYFPNSKIKTEYYKACAIAMLAKADFGENVNVDRSIKRSLLARYQGGYSMKDIGLDNLLESYGNVSTGSFVKGDDYEADKVELGKNAGAFTKAAFFLHRYTVRYYVIGMRMYVRKVKKIALDAKVGGDKKKSELIEGVGLFFLPFLLFVTFFAILLKPLKIEFKLKLKRIVGLSIAFYLLSVALYYFGMSIVSMYFTFVILPMLVVVMYVFRDSLFKYTPPIRAAPVLHRYNPNDPSEDGGPGTGYWFNDKGERCWNGND